MSSATLNYKHAWLVGKPHRDIARHLRQAVGVLEGFGVRVTPDHIAAGLLQRSDGAHRDTLPPGCDIVIVIGGDGTFLSVARHAVDADIPVAGFNLGALGFLTELDKDHIPQHLHQIFHLQPRISRRALLQIRINDQSFTALNDLVINKGNIARIIKLELELGRNCCVQFSGDGLIIATPTGSTAYSLSAGGPIVSPIVNGFVITPICPHSLTFRPLVIPDTADLAISLLSENTEVFATMDGQTLLPLPPRQRIVISRHPKSLQMIVSDQMNYFQLLNQKLKWGL